MSFLFSRDDEEERAIKEAADLRAFWDERGFIVNTSVIRNGKDRGGRAVFEIKTDMVNGFPQRRKA